jgi:hypothetical protein
VRRGFVCMWRKELDSPVLANDQMWKLYTICLMRANHAEGRVSVRGVLEPVKLKPGEFLSGRNALHYSYHQGHINRNYSDKLRPVARTLYRYLQTLEKMEILSIKKHTKYSIISINNWEAHQNLSIARSIAPSTNNHYKPFSKDSKEFRLSELLLDLILERRNGFKTPDLQKWAKSIELMIRKDGRNPKEVERVIRWCQADPFWQNNTWTLRRTIRLP